MSKFNYMRRFNLMVPESVFGVDKDILRPINSWNDKEEYKIAAKKLAHHFVENFRQYEAGVPADVIKKGGPNLDF